jgi:DNA-binding transcriptional MerR regulator/methylmalonyl-CoA mutase cobalamin-binding subunit
MDIDRSGFNISAVERDTGLSKDLLRMWERRYGYPSPARDASGERQYSVADVAKLRAIKRLMDVGMRPGKIIHGSLDELNALADARARLRKDAIAPALERDIVDALKRHDAAGLQSLLAQLAMRQGLQSFVLESVTPLNRAVGEAWMRGDLAVFEEHLYTEQVNVALRAAINAFPRAQAGEPRVLLTTFPNEQHGLGLLMVEALLVGEGAHCVSLGTQTPIDDVRRATIAHRAQILALSFSGSFALRVAVDGLDALRAQLPGHVTIWAGGEMTRRMRKTMPGVVLLPDLASAIPALKSWRTHHVPQRGAA